MDFERTKFMQCQPDLEMIWKTYFTKSENQDTIKVDEFLNGLLKISDKN